MPYRKLILKAMDELQDSHMRSSLDAIYRYVESNLPNGIECNYPLFLTDLKSLAEDGDLELTATYCGLTPEYKKRRVSDIQRRAIMLQKYFPDIDVSMMDGSSMSTQQRAGNHIKHKEAKRRVLGRYSWYVQHNHQSWGYQHAIIYFMTSKCYLRNCSHSGKTTILLWTR
jgi:hypothetical protein